MRFCRAIKEGKGRRPTHTHAQAINHAKGSKLVVEARLQGTTMATGQAGTFMMKRERAFLHHLLTSVYFGNFVTGLPLRSNSFKFSSCKISRHMSMLLILFRAMYNFSKLGSLRTSTTVSRLLFAILRTSKVLEIVSVRKRGG